MKSILLVLLGIVYQSFSYAQSINEKFCKEKIVTYKDHSVITIFEVSRELSDTEIALLENNFYAKKSIYKVVINESRSEIFVYHLSQVHYEDLKLLIQNTSIQLIFISTEVTEFKDQVFTNLKIEK